MAYMEFLLTELFADNFPFWIWPLFCSLGSSTINVQAVTGPKEALLNSTELRLALRSEPYNEEISLLGCHFTITYQPIFLKVDQCQPHENFWTTRKSSQVVNWVKTKPSLAVRAGIKISFQGTRFGRSRIPSIIDTKFASFKGNLLSC